MPILVPALLARWLRQAADAADHLGLEAALVGGAVRDLLLGREPTDIDLVVAGRPEDVGRLARELGRRLGLASEEHDPFGTATLQSGAVRIDLAMRRREAYQRPGALPAVEPGGWEDDLLRRDFTVNAVAWPLSHVGDGPDVMLHRRDLVAAAHALDDLTARRVRILHEGSFEDDPTRVFRAARLAARLGFHLEHGTRALAAQAVGGGALQTLSGHRLGQELRLAAAEGEALQAFRCLDELGVWQTLLPGWQKPEPPPDAAALAQAICLTEAALHTGEPWRARLVAWVSAGAGETAALWCRSLGWTGADTAVCERSLRDVARCRETLPGLPADARPSAIAAALGDAAAEAQAAFYSRAPDSQRLLLQRYWQGCTAHQVQVSGRDLQSLGWTPGPAFSHVLAEAARRVLDGELPDRQAQLAWLAQQPRP